MQILDSVSRVAASLQQVSEPDILLIWCDEHPLDFVLKNVYVNLENLTFYVVISAVIGYFRRQQILIKDVWSQIPKVVATTWESKRTVNAWFIHHNIAVEGRFEAKTAKLHSAASPVGHTHDHGPIHSSGDDHQEITRPMSLVSATA